jgi:hypothetical protein
MDLVSQVVTAGSSESAFQHRSRVAAARSGTLWAAAKREEAPCSRAYLIPGGGSIQKVQRDSGPAAASQVTPYFERPIVWG